MSLRRTAIWRRLEPGALQAVVIACEKAMRESGGAMNKTEVQDVLAEIQAEVDSRRRSR